MSTTPKERYRAWRRFGATLAGTAFTLVAPGAMAATITVNSTSDANGDNGCTLRNAIMAANSNEMSGGCMAGDDMNDTIVFGDGIMGSTITLGGTALPTIASGSTLTIGMADSDDTDASANGVTIDANQQSRIFTNQGTLTLNGLTLVNGMTVAGDAGADDRSGGAILNDDGGVLTVNGGAMNDNTADRAGGAIEEASGAAAGSVAVTLNDVDFAGNDAGMNPGNGGVLHVTGVGDIVIEGSLFDGNTAVEGGALWNNGGTMTVADAIFSANRATGGSADAGDAEGQGGGAIFAQNVEGATVTVTGSRFDGNSAEGNVSSGGAIFMNEGTVLELSGSTLADNTANRAGGAIELRAGVEATIDGSDMTANTANTTAGGGGGNGGAIHVTGDANVMITGGVYAQNSAVEGGALWNNQGEMTLDGVNVVGNDATGADATQGGGGIYAETNDAGEDSGTLTISDSRIVRNTASGAAGSGGGILLSPGTTATITDSRIMGNSANRAGGGIENANGALTLERVMLGGTGSGFGNDAGTNPGNGGGLHIGGAGTVDVVRSSVGYNTAVNGGGLWNSGMGTLTVNTATVSNNSADVGAGVYLDGAGGTITLDFVSVTQNDGTGVAAAMDAGGSIAIADSLIAENASNLGDGVMAAEDDGNVVGDSAMLGAYRLFGGPTATQPLMSGSAAIDATADCAAMDDDTDQRGATRPFDVMDVDNGGDCDAGAFEATDDPVLTVTANGPSSVMVEEDGEAPSVLGFTLANNDDDAVTVAGFSGYVERDAAFSTDANPGNVTLTVYLDGNGNGVFDMGETEVAAASLDDNGTTFSVVFNNGGASIPAGDSMSYVVVAEPAEEDPQAASVTGLGSFTPLYAGGALLGLVGLFSAGGLRRRTQLLLVVTCAAVMLTACSDGDADIDPDRNGNGNGGMDNGMGGDPAAPLVMDQARFVLQTLDASGTDDLVIGDGLPVYGPAVTFASEASAEGDDNNP